MEVGRSWLGQGWGGTWTNVSIFSCRAVRMPPDQWKVGRAGAYRFPKSKEPLQMLKARD